MTARRRERSDPESEAREILAADGAVDPHRLIDIIQRVNPTDLHLTATVTARRYELKGRLQSLLIARFREALVVALDSSTPGTVVIRHRASTRSACHAVLDALDSEARAWVQQQLDGAPDAPSARPSTDEAPRKRVRERSPPVGVDDPVAQARAALDAYDYEAARAILEGAVRADPQHEGATLALVELLVDHLADDGAALAWEPRLDGTIRARPEVRAMLALAAARVGDEARARRALRGVEHPRVGEVSLALATIALARDDLEAATQEVAAARRADPTLQVDRVTAEIARRRECDLRPLEEQLRASLRAGDLVDASAKAAEILARFPDHALAREVRRDERARHRQRAIEAVEVALERDSLPAVRDAMRELAAQGEVPEILARRLAAREAEARRRRDEAEAEAVHGALAKGDLRGALERWAACGEGGRRSTLAHADVSLLRWFDAAVGADDAARIDAVLALAAAVVALDEGATQEVIDGLTPYREALAGVARAREVVAEARRRIDTRAAEASMRCLGRAEEALEAGDLTTARDALSRIDGRLLEGRARARFAELDATLRRCEEHRATLARLAALRAAGALMEARAVLRGLLQEEVGEARLRWKEEHDAVEAGLRRRWGVELAAGGDEAQPWEASELAWAVVGSERTRAVFGKDDMLRLVEVVGREVFVQVGDVRSGRIRARVRWTLPKECHGYVPAMEGDVLWLCGADVAGVRGPTWVPEAWWSMEGITRHAPSGWLPIAPPESGVLWVQLIGEGASGARPMHVIDLRAAHELRSVSGYLRYTSIPWAGRPAVLAQEDYARAQVYTAQGKPLATIRIGPGIILREAVEHPLREEGAIVFGQRAEEGGKGTPLRVAEARPGAAAIVWDLVALEDWTGGTFRAVTSRRDKATYVMGPGAQGMRLVCVAFDGERLTRRWSVAATEGTSLLTLDDGQTFAMVPDGDRLNVEAIGPDLPLSAQACPIPDARIGPVTHSTFCIYGASRSEAQKKEIVRAWARSSHRFGAWVTDHCEGLRAAPRDLLLFLSELRLCEALLQAHGFFHQALAQTQAWHPDDAALSLLRASALAARGRWDECLDQLPASVEGKLLPAELAHRHHLRGLSLLRLGRRDEARAAFEAGMRYGAAHCGLEVCAAVARPVDDPPAPDDRSPHAPVARQLVVRSLAAERHLRRGDAAAAIEALSIGAVQRVREVQTTARLAAAWLERDATTDDERFEKARALARLAVWRPGAGPDLPLADAHWSDATIEALVRRAVAWLEDDRTRRGVSDRVVAPPA